MILNAFSVVEIFLAAVSLVLTLWIGIAAGIGAVGWRRAATAQERSAVEDRSHLVLLVAMVVLGIRLASWPWFYATLQSFVPDIDGAMCIFGVTRVYGTVTGISELLKPVTFFAVGGWLALHGLDRTGRTSSLMGRKLLFLVVAAVVVAADSALDIAQMLAIGPGKVVSCCTTVTDVLERPTRLLPPAALGPGYGSVLAYGSFGSAALFTAAMAALRGLIKPGEPPVWRRAVLGLAFLFAIGNGVVFAVAQVEVFAPRIMQLPYHHCLYCLWQYVPDTIGMYGLAVVASAAPGWALLLDLMGRTGETPDALHRYLRWLLGTSALCSAAALIMNAAHMLVA